MITLYQHQRDAINQTDGLNRVAYYHDMGLGKTFTGSFKLMKLDARVNLIVCQKSKIDDWLDHFDLYSDMWCNHNLIYDLTDKNGLEAFMGVVSDHAYTQRIIGVINYELVWRRRELLQLQKFTLLLDESSLIQNENAKRSSFILKMRPANVILLSGTPTGGKYENLWSQMNLLGWPISKQMYWNQYIDFHYENNAGFPLKVIDGYKNVDRLKMKMRAHGCHFLKTDEVFTLPDQIHQPVRVPITKEYRQFRKDRIVEVHTKVFDHLIDSSWDGKTYDDLYELVGDTTLTRLLYERQLCGQYNREKLLAFRDLVESTNDRLIVFYNFYAELDRMQGILQDTDFGYTKRFSLVNGEIKALKNYENREDSITFIQYQAGAMGLNLQKANKIIYFTPPLSSELFEQSKKRIHRIGQHRPCFYYYLICKGSVEEKIYGTLEKRKDYTEQLFEQDL